MIINVYLFNIASNTQELKFELFFYSNKSKRYEKKFHPQMIRLLFQNTF